MNPTMNRNEKNRQVPARREGAFRAPREDPLRRLGAGDVEVDQLETLLSGHHPFSGEQLGSRLVDRHTKHGTVIKAVAGYDATFSAPKLVSAWWGLTGDPGVKVAHDLAVQVVLDHIEAHATTRVRVNGPRMFPDVEHGLMMAVFPQSTSREDDPQLHTHAVISGKVIGANGRWYDQDPCPRERP